MRRGTLTDAQTLGMYEDGMSIIALCVHEGLTAYGVIGRLSRARRQHNIHRASWHRRPTKIRQETYTSFEQLREAVERLERMTR